MGIVKNLVGNAQEFAGQAGTFLGKVKDNEQFTQLAKKLHVEPFLFALDKVNISKAKEHVDKVRKDNPTWEPQEISGRLIQEKAVLLGAQGFATSVMPGLAGGLFAVDIAASIAAQAELIYQIACAYDMDLHDSARKGEALTIFSLAFGGNAAIKAGLGFARNIPMAGALIGAGGNAAMTYALGTAADHYYKAIYDGQSDDAALSEIQQTSEKILEEAVEQESALDGILAHMILAGQPQLKSEDIETSLSKLPLEETSRGNIIKHIQTLRDFDILLSELQPEYGLVALAQAERLARSDAQITEKEKFLLDRLEQHFQEQAQTLDAMLPGNYILADDFKHTIRGLQFSQDGVYLCACSDDKSLKIWKTYDECSSFQLIYNIDNAHKDEIKALALSQNDELLVTASKDSSLIFWDYRNGQLIRSFESGHRKGINTLAFGADQLLASGSEDGEIKLWNTEKGAAQRSLLGHKNSILSLAFDPSGRSNLLASGANDNTVRLWNPYTGETIKELAGHHHGVYAVAFSPDGQTIVTGSWDRKICLWDLTTGEKKATLEGHKAAVWQLVFTQDGRHLISSSDDNMIIIWDLASNQIRLRLDGHQNGIYSLALSPIAPVIASGSWDCTLRIWRIDLG